MRIAIISTVCNAEHVIASFIQYHKSIGFTDFIFFFDNPEEEISINYAKSIPGVKVFLNNDDLKEMWKTCSLYEHFKDFDDTELTAKQILNLQTGISYALENEIDWILHIDMDETFCLANCHLSDHFRELDELGIQSKVYWNNEAVPEKIQIEDYFSEVTLFKMNPRLLLNERYNDEQLAYINRLSQFPKAFFHFYGNGKSSAKVSEELLPFGAHRFKVAENKVTENYKKSDPFVLHYPCCGFNHYLAKYKSMGLFNDKWIGRFEIRDYIGDFHVDSRDKIHHEGVDKAQEYYREKVFIDKADIIAGLEIGILRRITIIADSLRKEAYGLYS